MAPDSPARRRPLVLAALALGLISVAIGLSAGPASGQGSTLPYENASLPINQRVNDLLGRMTLAEKVGQMTQTERLQVDENTAPIKNWHLGSILSGGGSVPTPNRPEAWADMVDRFQRAAMRTRLHIPILYGIDTVHGDGNMFGATVFPHNIGLGATRDPALVRDVGAHRRRGDPRERTAVGVRALHLRGPRRPLGPDV